MSLGRIAKHIVEKIRSNKFLRDVVMSVIGTTISIALTFGTAEMKNAQKKQQDGRRTVMMVVHDMDESVKAIRDLSTLEETNREVALFAMSKIDSLDTLPGDTLTTLLQYMQEGTPFDIDNTNEKIFQSSQDTWKNIENKSVIDLIQEFYRHRRATIEEINTNFLFKAPITKEKEYELLLSTPDHYIHSGNADKLLKNTLQGDEMDLFLKYSTSRQKYFSDVADNWQRISDQCKFMMSITDDEMTAYIENAKRTGLSLTPKLLVGKWIETAQSDAYRETIEFFRGNTFVHTLFHETSSTLYSGHVKSVRTMPGTWEIRGDSLIRNYTTGERYEMDISEISYTEEMADTVKKIIERNQQRIDELNEQAKTTSFGRRANLVYIDKSGNKIEMHTYTKEEEDITRYLVRDVEKE